MSDAQRGASTPEIRPTQFENADVTSLKNSVNLFRGDVNLQQTLVTLPGKVDDDTLQVQVTLLYQSNVHQQVETWNLDAPTGPLGLGWSLNGERISAQGSGSLSQASRQYQYESGGIGTPLAGTSDRWVRGMVSSDLASILGSSMSSSQIQQLVDAYAQTGLTLSTAITVTAQGTGVWTVDDSDREHLWTLRTVTGEGGADAIEVADGGQAFELQSYQFWKIRYYPKYERWEITDDSGTLKVFGGGVTATGGKNTSTGNSVEWGVCWGAGGSWGGSSSETSGQSQYAKAWNLCAKVDRYGDTVAFAYNEFPEVDGLISMGVEQLVCTGGMPYTKASYLTSITTPFGYRATFSYKYKTYTATAQEYMDPHFELGSASAPNAPPSNLGTPDGYQDEYGVLLLATITAASEEPANPGSYQTIFSLGFEYTAPIDVSAASAPSPTRVKSLLQAITWTSGAGQTLPGYQYDYNLYADGAAPANVGALASVTYPQGSRGTFTYAEQELPICRREHDVLPPAAIVSEDPGGGGVIVDGTPRVWFGPDYAVTLWVDQAGTEVYLEVHTWNGRWMTSTPAEKGVLYSSTDNGIDPSSLQAITNQDSFVITCATQDFTALFPFHRDGRTTSRWIPFEQDGVNYLSITNVTSIEFAAGDHFVLAAVKTASGSPAYSLYRFTYDWRDEHRWTIEEPLAGFASLATPIYVLAQSEYYACLLYDDANSQGTLTLNYLDQAGRWQQGAPTTLALYLGDNDQDQAGTPRMVWAGGPSMLAYTVAAGEWTSFGADFDLHVLRWDTGYDVVDQDSVTGVNEMPLREPEENPAWPPQPRVVANTAACCRGTILRFNGAGWDTYAFAMPQGSGLWLSYAYGDDVFLQAFNNGSDQVVTQLVAYDATNGAFSAPQTTTQSTTGAGEGWPSAAGSDWISAGNGIRYRGTSPSWASAFSGAPAYTVPSGVDTLALIDQSPSFMATLVPGAGSPSQRSVQLLVLHDDQVLVPGAVAESAYFTVAGSSGPDAGIPGQYPAGSGAIALFPAEFADFQSAQRFSLYRYAGNSLTGAIQGFPVRSLSIDVFGESGSETLGTAYRFRAADAGCDPSGQVVKYYQSAVYDGCTDVSASAFGRTVTLYQNGATEPGPSMLDGQPLQTIYFAGEALFLAAWSRDLGLDPTATPNGDPQPVSSALVSLFAANGQTLASGATQSYRQIGDDQGYRYWFVEDTANDRTYNLELDPDPAGGDGLQVFSGRLVKYSANRWRVFEHRNGNPVTPEPIRLYGGFARTVEQLTFQDGVALTTRYDFRPVPPAGAPEARLPLAPYTGGVQFQRWSLINLEGETEANEQQAIFGAQVYPRLAWANVLRPTAQLSTRAAIGGAPPVTVSSAAVSWKDWTAVGGVQVFDVASHLAWKGDPSGADAGDYPFQGPANDFWVADTTVTARSPNGVAIETRDAGGLVHATLLDSNAANAIAIAANASFASQEVDYCGFEPEQPCAWTLAGGAEAATGNAHTGAYSLHLPAGGASASRTLTPKRNDRAVIVSCWYQVGGTAAATGAGLRVAVMNGETAVGDPVLLAFTAAPSAWAYAHAVIDLAPYHQLAGSGDPLSLVLSTEMGDAPELWIDDVCAGPKTGSFTAQVHDPLTGRATAKISLSGKTVRTLYDPYYRTLGVEGAHGAPHGLRLTYYSRQGHASFDPSDPNAELRIQASEGGSAETFLDGQDWRNAWTADDAGAWTAAGGRLSHASAGASNTLTPAASIDGGYALYFELLTPEAGVLALGAGFAVRLGDDGSAFAWDGSSWTWNPAGGSPQPSLSPASGSPDYLTLIATGETLAFLADGQLLFSVRQPTPGAPTLVSGANALALRNLVLLQGPSLHLELQDATGKRRQTQVLGQLHYLVTQHVRDAAGHEVVKTKAIPGDFGQGRDQPVLQYRAGLVDLSAFQATIQTTGVMQGDAASYYSGAHGSTDDQGYPYTRYRFEPSPLKRVAEIGAAGAANAIVESTPLPQRPTVRYFRGPNPALDLGGLAQIPAGRYAVTARLDQLGSRSLTVKNAVSVKVAKLSDQGGDRVINATAVAYGTDGARTTVWLPSSFQQGAAQQLTVTRRYNPLGQLVEERSPSAGTTRYLFDDAGRLRFVQGAEDAARGVAVFMVYDELGRKRARGTVPCAQWPPSLDAAASGTVQIAWSYDGDGTTASDLGNLTSAVTHNGTTATVNERWAWHLDGRVKTKTTGTVWADGSADGPFAVSYGFDNLRRPTSIAYPASLDGVTLETVSYGYDGLGRLRTVEDQAGTVLARLRHDASGKLRGRDLAAEKVLGPQAYDSPGRLLSVAAESAQGSYRSSYEYQLDGSMKSWADDADGTPAADTTFGYALLNQLGAADDGVSGQTRTYDYTDPASGLPDLDGNIHSLQPSGDSFAYPTPNQLQQVTWGAGGTTTFGYNADGTVSSRTSAGAPSVPDLGFTYFAGTILPSAITVGTGTTVQLVYNCNGRRVGKRVCDGTGAVQSSIASVPGPLRPFAQIAQDGSAVAYVYGPLGTVAMYREATRYGVATDILGSTRAVFDTGGNVVASYRFLPYGSTAAAVEPSPGWMPLLFTGQELDGETGLYNMNARLYDPRVLRFYAPDPANQYPSAYVYTGNHPVLLTDPTGMITQGEQAALAGVLGLVALAGLGLSLAIDPEAAPAVVLGMYAASGFLTSAGSAGLSYDVTHSPSSWSWADFFGQALLGGLTGAAGGVISGSILEIGNLAAEGAASGAADAGEEIAGGGVEEGAAAVQNSKFQQALEDTKDRALKSWKRTKVTWKYQLGGRMVGYSVQGMSYTIYTNIMYGYPLNDYWNVAFWSAFGAGYGFLMGGASIGGNFANDTLLLADTAKTLGTALAGEPEYAFYAAIAGTAVYSGVTYEAFTITNNLINRLLDEYGSQSS